MQEDAPVAGEFAALSSRSDKGGNTLMHRPLRTLQLFAVTTTLALAGYVYLRHRQIRTQQEQPFGRYTARQLTDRTLPLCQMLWPDDDRAAVSAEHILTQDSHRRLWRLWTVDYTDKNGAYLAEFTWDAQTGELVWVGHRTEESGTSPSAFAPSTHPLTEAQAQARAVRLSYHWLGRLGFAREGSNWHLTGAPMQATPPGYHVWSTVWGSGERAVLVKVNVISGELVYAQRSHPSALPPVP
jgi:hypothetical protein